ncbi:MAG: RluA family pseudouridine synthase [Planctomycetota bacterium]|nr:RluA family pseudouridine synthase [Planctomycetota bacterium]
MSDEDISPLSIELSDQPLELTVESRAHGWRLDHYLVRLFPNYSRALLQKAVSQESTLVNGLSVKPSRRLRVNDRLSVCLPDLPDSSLVPEDIPLDVVHEDESLIVINKAAGMIVHPGKGNYRGTLAGALQFHFDRLSDVAGRHRPGIVHRLDRDTSGVLVVAKDNQVHGRLSEQFEKRTVKKTYQAIVYGQLEFDSDYIETYIRKHPKQREKMQNCAEGSNARFAKTFYEVVERFDGFTHVRLHPQTGRTHQLRLHMLHLKRPIVADLHYAGRRCLNLSDVASGIANAEDRPLLARQALHAHRLEFDHPQTQQRMCFEAPLAPDISETLEAMRDRCGSF